MGAKSPIQWTDSSWTPLRARVRDDAAEIAAAKGYTSLIAIAKKMAGHVGPHCEKVSEGCDNCYSCTNNERCLPQNGTGLHFDRRSRDLVELFIDENILKQLLRWRKPRRVFVCSQTDLFADYVPIHYQEQVFRMMLSAPQHTHQVLTKRADVMAERVPIIMNRIFGIHWAAPRFLHLGFSAETQEWFDKRAPHVKKLADRGWMTWCSYEPALGPLDVTAAHWLRWLVCGGESGTSARPFDVDWARDVRDDCKAMGCAFFMKQVGPNPVGGGIHAFNRKDRKGGDMESWPTDIRVREFPTIPAGG